MAMIGDARYWFAGDCDAVVIDKRPTPHVRYDGDPPDAGDELKLALVGREPSRPLIGVVWLRSWRYKGPPAFT